MDLLSMQEGWKQLRVALVGAAVSLKLSTYGVKRMQAESQSQEVNQVTC